MADRNKELPPILKDRLAEVGEITREEKARVKELEGLDSMLGQFYKGYLDVTNLWEKLEGFEGAGKQFLLRDAYTKLKGSFKWKGLPIKFEEQADGTIHLEFRQEEEQEPTQESTAEELVLSLTDHNFSEALKSYPLLVVDFWAEWCAPCRMIAPVIDTLAEAYRDKITFARLNVEYNQLVPARYRVMSIPALFVFKNGQIVDQMVGAMSREVLEPKLTRHLPVEEPHV